MRKALELHGLDDIAVDSELIALCNVLILMRRCQHHNRNHSRALITLELAQYFPARPPWEDANREKSPSARNSNQNCRAEDVLQRLDSVVDHMNPVDQMIFLNARRASAASSGLSSTNRTSTSLVFYIVSVTRSVK